tara:strand:+ start:10170 stop:11645 length:1476 start_codon:yes stop_codon:yes gene_type:complete
MNLSDYAFGQGLEGAGYEAVSDLHKALVAGDITGGASANQATPGSGAPLKVESLDREMKLLTFNDSYLRLWQLIPKSAAYNTVEEFNQLKSYGSEFGGAYPEGQLGEEENSTYVRRTEKIKYYSEVGSVSLPMQMVRSFDGQGALQREVKNRTMNLLRKINKAIAFGSESIVPVEANGMYRQHEIGIGQTDEYSDTPASYYSSPWVIDLKGATLTQDQIEEAGTLIMQDGFGTASHLFGTPGVFSNFAKDYYDNQRIFLNQGQGSIAGGVNIGYPKKVTLSYGDVALEHDVFLAKKSESIAGTASATSTKSPNAPTSSTVSAPVTDADSQFGTAFAGDYKWAVRAKNLYGFSAVTELDASAAVTIADGESADLTFASGGGANPATGYQILRTEAGGSTYFPIFEVSTAQLAAGYNGAAAGKVRDRNFSIPNTEDASMTDLARTLEIKQLAPLMKLDLATVAPATRFTLLCYWLLQLYAPLKMVKFVNCKHR